MQAAVVILKTVLVHTEKLGKLERGAAGITCVSDSSDDVKLKEISTGMRDAAKFHCKLPKDHGFDEDKLGQLEQVMVTLFGHSVGIALRSFAVAFRWLDRLASSCSICSCGVCSERCRSG